MNAALAPLLGPAEVEGETGSNSWVVSGSRTASGRPLLSNDPHLAASIPSVFAQVGLHCRTVTDACPYDVAGFSLASVPGVVIGHNTTIAWGLTTSHLDVQDLYLESVDGNQVRVGDALVPLETVTEQIRVAGEDQPRTITIRSSRHGPLLSDVSQQLQRVAATQAPPAGPGYAVALSWVGPHPGPHHGRASWHQPGPELRRVPRGRGAAGRPVAEPGLRRRGGQHRLPAPRDGAAARQGRRPHARRRAGTRRTTGGG